ncbi:MAG: circadian clock KaiB family protein [Pseudanabaenaceae cyanobacterium]
MGKDWQFEVYFLRDSRYGGKGVVQELRRLLQERLGENYELAEIDVRENPERAEVNRVVAIPTLIRRRPLPECRYLGALQAAKLDCLLERPTGELQYQEPNLKASTNRP